MKLKATKALTYNTRRLLPGDVFETSPRDARLLLAIRKAEAIREPVQLAPPPPAIARKIAETVVPAAATGAEPVDTVTTAAPKMASSVGAMTMAHMANAPPPSADLAAARAEYERVSGKKAFNGWDVATLQAKTAAAKAV